MIREKWTGLPIQICPASKIIMEKFICSHKPPNEKS
jgi:hypothetical protein